MSAADIRRSDSRFVTQLDWLTSKHSFSFGAHYDPTNTGFGLLLVNNDDVVAPGAGFASHDHRDMEIVTWVLDGELAHADSAGHAGTVRPGQVQRMSAGTGVRHSEHNAREDAPVHFVQMWALPDTPGLEPDYEQADVSAELASGRLVSVASGRSGQRSAVALNQRNATLHGAELAAGKAVELPDAPFVHVYLPRGEVDVDGVGRLDAGDALRLRDDGGRRVVAGSRSALLLVWEMHSAT